MKSYWRYCTVKQQFSLRRHEHMLMLESWLSVRIWSSDTQHCCPDMSRCRGQHIDKLGLNNPILISAVNLWKPWFSLVISEFWDPYWWYSVLGGHAFPTDGQDLWPSSTWLCMKQMMLLEAQVHLRKQTTMIWYVYIIMHIVYNSIYVYILWMIWMYILKRFRDSMIPYDSIFSCPNWTCLNTALHGLCKICSAPRWWTWKVSGWRIPWNGPSARWATSSLRFCKGTWVQHGTTVQRTWVQRCNQ